LNPEQERADWEAAYMRFETPEEELAKFTRRLRGLGAESWSRDASVLELFCGRGSGLRAWHSIGFERIEGLDISPELVACYDGPGHATVGDARELPYHDASRDIVCVQGGLHHLVLPHDLHRVLREVQRILVPGGRFVTVEPWLTPFLRVVHTASESQLVRKLSARVDAFARMVAGERTTYEDWLGQPAEILAALSGTFHIDVQRTAWGKLSLIGRKATSP
jgi:ubiquinone/menaquinone biosynthesis C-methylase UbiE